jgi:electron transfer flavoprotein alpha subunit
MLLSARPILLKQARTGLTIGPTHRLFSAPQVQRLLSTLAILEQKDGKFLPNSLNVISAAKTLGGPVTGFLAGKNIKEAATEAAKIDGLEKIITIDNEAYEKVTT